MKKITPRPLIKWPGGKGSEIGQFLHLIPDHDRYIEPFAGGAALYFHLNPPSAILNDTSRYLMDFYELVKAQDREFHRILNLQCRTFGALQKRCDDQYGLVHLLFGLYEKALSEEDGASKVRELKIHHALVDKIVNDETVVSELIPDREEFFRVMRESVEDKMIRTVRNHQKKPLSASDLKDNLITGFTSGFYLYLRNVFNDIASGRMITSDAYRCANFYFIREYCYGSMFRYNRKGEFNIPYGGISYNRKDLTSKVERMFSGPTASLLGRTQLYCMDFEELMTSLDMTDRDFVFLDPPYDTEFSDYEGNEFGPEDQARLAALLENLKASFILVIKDTPLIRSLYEGKFRILPFENRYLYNMRSRNDRNALHLIITNVPEGQVPWLRENM